MQLPLLEVKNLTLSIKQRDTNCPLLKDISFSLFKGETMALVGESGSGKSTLALSLLQLQSKKDFVIEQGSILWKGEDILQMSEKQKNQLRKKELKIIFQDPFGSLHPQKKIGTQILEAYSSSSSLKEKKQHIKQFLTELDLLEETYTAYPFQLSGGQQQRVILAIALINSPQFLIADEPTTALDYETLKQILAVLKNYKKSLSVLFISHKLKMLYSFLHKAYIIKNHCLKKYDLNQKEPFLNINKTKKKTSLLLSIQKLSVSFKNSENLWQPSKKVLHNLNFELFANRTVGIMGLSGSGKTTLLKAILNITPYQGDIYWKGKHLKNFKKQQWQEFRCQVAPVFQDPSQALSPKISVEKILLEGLNLHTSFSLKEKEQKILLLMDKFQLNQSILQKYPHQLSGGQQQRLAIARVFLYKPQILLLDEPTSFLDLENQNRIFRYLLEYKKKNAVAYLIVSHDQELLKSVADNIFFLQDKTLIQYKL